MELIEMALSQLHAHPLNSNVMEERLLAKLTNHIVRSGRYPPVIVRPLPAGKGERFQILDGHHRVEAVRRAGLAAVRCVIWEVDDGQALLLLATLNRLQGQDDPHKRAKLIEQIKNTQGVALEQLVRDLPERSEQLKALAALEGKVDQRLPRQVDDLPVPVHFFLSRAQRSELLAKLKSIGGTREEALMNCVMNHDKV